MLEREKMSKTIIISGGFDPIHIGHIRMIEAAAKLGKVTAVVNSDNWLLRKKGYVFMSFKERCEVLQSIKGVSEVSGVDDTDKTVCEALRRLKPDIFGNGGDRTDSNTPEQAVCEELGIEMVWSLGGGKIQSSSELVTKNQSNIRLYSIH